MEYVLNCHALLSVRATVLFVVLSIYKIVITFVDIQCTHLKEKEFRFNYTYAYTLMRRVRKSLAYLETVEEMHL